MSIPDGFKVSEVGVIPVDWDVKKLGDIVIKIVGGGTPSRNIKEYWNGNIFWATVKDLTSFNSYLTQETITKEGLNSSASNLIPKGNLIISTRMAVGKVVIYNVDVAINQDLKAIFIKPDIDTRFLFFYFIGYSNKIDFLASGSTVKGIVLEDLRNLQIPLPPLAEQKAIAQSLSDVDNLITAIDKLITKKRNIKQGTMQELLTGKKRLPGFTGEWEVKKLGDVAPLQRGFDLPTSKLIKGNYPVVYSNGILNFHIEYKAKAPGVVTGRSGTLGKVTFIDKDYWPHNTSLWVTDFKGNHSKFIYYLYIFIRLERFGTGSGVPTLNRNDVHAFQVSYPPTIEEQKAIAKILTEMDEEIEALEKKREKYKNIKQGMMQELLTGKTRIIDN
ncbi:restriction endonuclease subunit S [Anabaena aphanizomenioides LEGE 00250]|uniref:Restriction endonuclease subunit S n=1 Tax=Sphaerospermopsis aphanizomenoides LEGE 00250 TaxID=2777972 RepID=A0ABR9VJH6_9CYAN|nr:restriction endonuclease subunit S [Sphaerospermopsis aphanizomenoides]MBE9238642.1 restriction endonuclease subunit S [Sphaerospermopsis aphanizomenoides LEGE 00250]